MNQHSELNADAVAPHFLTAPEAADRLRLSASTLAHMRRRGDGPPFVAVSRRRILYRTHEIERWLEKRSFLSTHEYASA